MNFFKQKIAALKWRLKCLSYGIIYRKHRTLHIPQHLFINKRIHKINFIDRQIGSFRYEFTETCIKDGYHLKGISKKLKNIQTIVDVGANQGLFTIAARKYFSSADIYCYEPNKLLEPYLASNAASLEAKVYYEAVTIEDCKVQLNFGETDLHTTVSKSTIGEITGTSFQKVIERAGGSIDVLKIDCEGGEWELLEDEVSWKNVRSLTMEYHLWAKTNSTVSQLIERLNALDFKVIFHNPLTETFGLITAIKA